MRKFSKILKYVFYGIVSLVIIVCIGLLFYYQSIYRDTPLPAEAIAKPAFHSGLESSAKPVLLPIPKKMTWLSGHFTLPASIGFDAPAEDIETIKKICEERLNVYCERMARGSFTFIKSPLEPQSYILNIHPTEIKITYNDLQALFYAMTTVKQLAKQSHNQLPCVSIEDKPDLQTRGALLDISRGKVPKLATLYDMVDFLSDLKYNQLQLYIEGFSFGYPSFKNLWSKTETPLMPEEIRRLDAFCKERYIELVPNQNSLGHMDEWLKKDEFKDLAECPKGYKLFGLLEMKSTLSPANPKSIALVEKMSEDLLPNFTSNHFNVNLDEPFELGQCKDNPIHDPKEVSKVYINYARQLNDYVNSKGKTMMMWGDIVSKNPEIIPEIPKNIMLLEWRYESLQSFEKICRQYQESGRQYMVCPGTSTWTSFTGRTDNMLANVKDAATNGIKYGASGVLMTDWGNTPHLQYLTVSYAGFTYAAALAWNNNSESKSVLGSYLSRAVFNDPTNRIGDLVLEMGRYDQFEEYHSMAMTTTAMSYMFGIMDKTMLGAIDKKLQSGILEMTTQDAELERKLSQGYANPKIYNARAIINFADTLQKQLLQIHLDRPDSMLIIDEYKNALRMIRLGAELRQFNNYHLQQTDAENKTLLTEMKTLCTTIQKEHERLWMIRNKYSGLETTLQTFKNLETQIDDNLKLLEKNMVIRWANRVLEKIKTAAGVLYLRSS
jgi:hypothetical protein